MCDFRCSNWSFFSRLLAISRQAADVLCLGDPRWGKFLPLASTVCTDLGEADHHFGKVCLRSCHFLISILRHSTPVFLHVTSRNANISETWVEASETFTHVSALHGLFPSHNMHKSLWEWICHNIDQNSLYVGTRSAACHKYPFLAFYPRGWDSCCLCHRSWERRMTHPQCLKQCECQKSILRTEIISVNSIILTVWQERSMWAKSISIKMVQMPS